MKRFECFLIRDGVEQKAELEEILPLITDMGLQYLLRNVKKSNIHLAWALAHTPSEIKELIYRNMSRRNSASLEKALKAAEIYSEWDRLCLHEEKTKLISFIGENMGEWIYKEPKFIVWKEAESEEKISIGEKVDGEYQEPPDPVEQLIKIIEKACDSGHYVNTSEKNVRDAFAAFENRRDELQRIRSIEINAEHLPCVALLFEAGSLETLIVYGESTGSWPSFLEECRNLKSIRLRLWNKLTEFPSWIRNAASLQHLSCNGIGTTFIPDWIGDLQSLTELDLSGSGLTALPDSISKLKNLVKLDLSFTDIEKLPDWIGGLLNLAELNLNNNQNLKYLPDNIGKLKNLVTLDLSYTPIERLPDTIAHCTLLEYVDLRRTNIDKPPKTLSAVKKIMVSIELIPQNDSVSYRSFCNSYYTLVLTIIALNEKARREGLLALEEETEDLSSDFVRDGVRLIVDGYDAEIVRHILTLQTEREHDYYRKKLMEVAMEGILCIQKYCYETGDSEMNIILTLAALVDIKDNPLDAALVKYFSGDIEALRNINFNAALPPEDEREEIRFLKRVWFLSKTVRREGYLALDKYLDLDGIAAKDIFEYGLPLIADGWEIEEIDRILTMLIAHETNPVRKNLALAKKDAVKMLYEGDNPRLILMTLLAYFDTRITKDFEEVNND
jgi:flagellar motor component MotA